MQPRWRGTTVVPLILGVLGAWLPAGPPVSAQDDPIAYLDTTYMRRVVEDLTAIGSTEMGFRAFGTPQDLETATYIATR